MVTSQFVNNAPGRWDAREFGGGGGGGGGGMRRICGFKKRPGPTALARALETNHGPGDGGGWEGHEGTTNAMRPG